MMVQDTEEEIAILEAWLPGEVWLAAVMEANEVFDIYDQFSPDLEVSDEEYEAA